MSRKQLHVLTLTPFYPTWEDDAQGCFVAEPLPWLEKLGVRHTVIVAQPLYRASMTYSPSATSAREARFFSFPGGLGLPSAGSFLFSKIVRQVRKIHKSDHIDLIHAHSALPCGHAAYLLSRELKIPFVVTVHGLDAYSTNQVRGALGSWCERVSSTIYSSAARVICVSGRVREQVLGDHSHAMQTSVVYNGVDPKNFAPGENSNASKVILSVAGLIPIKGHSFLIQALAVMGERCSEYSCEIVGDGPELSRLQQLCAELRIGERVHFRGRMSRIDVTAAMRDCTLFVLPSRYEALGCVYLEAMSAGKPVVACRGQGIEEVIQQGQNGWLVDVDSATQLADTITILAEDSALRAKVGNAARQTILAGFTLERQAERLSQVYEECIR